MSRHAKSLAFVALSPHSFALGLFLLIPAATEACSVPVFRYAIERWQPSPYDVFIFHRGPMTDDQKKAVGQFERLAQAANVEIAAVDLNGPGQSEPKALWEKFGGKNPLPWVIARFPDSTGKTPPAWSGPLEVEKLTRLVDSPLRQEIVKRLFRGDTAVFIVLESGQEQADTDALKLIETELPKIQKRVQLPAPTKEGPQVKSELPVEVSLSHLRLSRKNADEAALIGLLMGCEGGLDKVKGPIVFAVFGRGRALTALHGKNLKASELETVAQFLCGACSCQVKELNPGMDLLFCCRWDQFLEIEIAPRPRQVISLSSEKR
jgi:hypothetical protein